jgi:LPXTG-motif cell wall-anchored protein
MVSPMRMRIATGLVLVIALMASGPVTAGAQISDSDNAAAVQYPDIETREEAPADNDLPVTGFVVIPLLVIGAVLLVTGGVMHVRTRQR